jgi:hypothetical protein
MIIFAWRSKIDLVELYVESRPKIFAKNLLTPINSLIGPEHTPYALCLHIFAGIEHDDLTAR